MIAPVFMLATVATTLLLPAASAQALTQKEKKECFEQWAGAYTGTAGTRKKINAKQLANFEDKSNCNQERDGSCKLNRDTDGAYIHCKDKTGKFTNGKDGWAGAAAAKPENPDGGSGTVDSGTVKDPVEGEGCGGVQTAFIKCDAKNSGDITDNGIWQLLLMVLNILTAGVGIIAVAGIVYGSVLYTTAEDKADQVSKAIGIIRSVVIGLVMFAFMWAGLNFIVPGGVFS